MVINIHFKPFKGLILHLNILRENSFFEGQGKTVQSSHKKRMDQTTKIPIVFPLSSPHIHSTAGKSRTNFRQMSTVWFYWVPRASPLRPQRQSAGKWANLPIENWQAILKYPLKGGSDLQDQCRRRAPHQWVWEEQPLVPGTPMSKSVVYLFTQGRSSPAHPEKEIAFHK